MILEVPVCPYCRKESELVTGKEIYFHREDLYTKLFYRCGPCGAHVGCYEGTERPLGTLADAALRRARTEAHASFDRVWKLRAATRKGCYKFLSQLLNLPPEKTHIGMFNIIQCKRTVEIGDALFQSYLANREKNET